MRRRVGVFKQPYREVGPAELHDSLAGDSGLAQASVLFLEVPFTAAGE
jgi:hypothetical protein